MSAPTGPRIKPVIHFDQDGQYTVFTGKACSVCAVGLTSRNRYDDSLLCIEHGKEKERARVRRPSGATKRLPQTPERMHLHSLFNAWATHPDMERLYGSLLAAMHDHEIKERLRRLLPPLPTPQGITPQES